MTVELFNPECGICKHIHHGMTTCDAFPNGIPEEILWGGRSHQSPYPGDGGIQFKPRVPFAEKKSIAHSTGTEER